MPSKPIIVKPLFFAGALLASCVLTTSARATVATDGLTIVPSFDSSITNDPNAANVEAAINSAISVYHQDFSNPVVVPIDFSEMSSGLGLSSISAISVSYSAFRSALADEPTSAVRTTALQSLPNQTDEPVPNTTGSNLWLSVADADALVRSGQLSTNYYSSPQYDGSISLDTSSTYTGTTGAAGKYDLEAVVEHEIDEVLGLGSALPNYGTGSGQLNAPRPEDLYRYAANGTRSFSTSAGGPIYFSLNGTTDLAQFNNSSGGDYGDWASNPLPDGASPQVQDAYQTPNVNITLGTNEFAALQAIGYVQVPDAAPFTLLALGFSAAFMLVRRRRSHGG